ncbi:MAG: NAD(P)H-hydrate epimerase [Cyanobium sp.]
MHPSLAWPAADADHLLVTAAQMAALEAQLFASGLPVEALMEKAALAISARLLARAGSDRVGLIAPGQAVLVLVGPGHNGGDGLVIARELQLAGIRVRIWSPFERHKPLTAAQLRHGLWLGIPRLEADPDPADPELWIDALFGIGQSRAPAESLQTLLETRQSLRPGSLLAVDGPTGLCADSGRLLGRGGATAALTWSIGLIKRGFIQDVALARVGQLERIDLGLPQVLLACLPAPAPLALSGRDGPLSPRPRIDPAASKYGRGRLLVVAGSRRFRGATHLALAGASASGCGSLRAAVPRELAASLWMAHPEVVLAAELGATAAAGLDLAPLAAQDFDRLDAILLGPGLGGLDQSPEPQGPKAIQGLSPLHASEASEGSQGLSDVAVDRAPLRAEGSELGPVLVGSASGEASLWSRLQVFPGLLVLDADGLNRLARRCSQAQAEHGGLDPSSGRSPGRSPGHGGELSSANGGGQDAAGWLRRRLGPTWITPHAAEFARLFPALQDLEPLQAASEAARSSGASVLLKGARSVVAAADGRCWQLLEAAPQAARAGLGDVLAGYAAGRGAQALAHGMGQGGSTNACVAADAALLAAVALAHAQAGLRCVERDGAGGASPQAVASDLRQF